MSKHERKTNDSIKNDNIKNQLLQQENARSDEGLHLDEAAFRHVLRQELDTHLFEGMTLNTTKQQELIRKMKQQAEHGNRRMGWLDSGRKRVLSGFVAAAVMLGVGIPVFLTMNDTSPLPGTATNGAIIDSGGITTPDDSGAGAGSSGPVDAPDAGSGGAVDGNGAGSGAGAGSGGESMLSELVIVDVATPAEAAERFGEAIRLPGELPNGFGLGSIQASGYPNEAAIRIHFEYQGDAGQSFIYTADKQEAAFGVDVFEPIDLNGTEGLIYAQPTLTELYWQVDGIQYSIVGSLNEAQAVALAQAALGNA